MVENKGFEAIYLWIGVLYVLVQYYLLVFAYPASGIGQCILAEEFIHIVILSTSERKTFRNDILRQNVKHTFLINEAHSLLYPCFTKNVLHHDITCIFVKCPPKQLQESKLVYGQQSSIIDYRIQKGNSCVDPPKLPVIFSHSYSIISSLGKH